MPSRADVEKYTQLLGVVNIAIPLAVELGFDVYDWIKQIKTHADSNAQLSEEQKAQVRAEAQAALDDLQRRVTTMHSYFADWLASHPPE